MFVVQNLRLKFSSLHVQARMMHAMKHPVLTSKKRDRFHMNSNGQDTDTYTSSAKNEGEGQGHVGRAWEAENTDVRCVLD